MPTSERGSKHADERRNADASEVIRDCEPEATIDRPDGTGYEEVYVVPEPGSERYCVFVLTATGHLHHVGAFDLERLAREEHGFAETTLGVLASERSDVVREARGAARDERGTRGPTDHASGRSPRADDETAPPSRTTSESREERRSDGVFPSE